MIGSLKFYRQDKGWGFLTIKPGEDIFFHVTDCVDLDPRTLGEGDQLAFEIGKAKDGIRTAAKQVRIPSDGDVVDG
ncbi:cold-shock protein [Methyloceanibacter sp.]|uniref:cold-shock protein n=1 Tax=Methyloceanibacter sp. TaxID=1965321 RepID=UPI003D6CC7E0